MAAYFKQFFDGQTYPDWRKILKVDRGLQDKHFLFLVWLISSSFWLSSDPIKVSVY
jgi:predicted butyrate kinase (DUF1464 family)